MRRYQLDTVKDKSLTMEVHVCNPRTSETEGFRGPAQPELHETQNQKIKENTVS